MRKIRQMTVLVLLFGSVMMFSGNTHASVNWVMFSAVVRSSVQQRFGDTNTSLYRQTLNKSRLTETEQPLMILINAYMHSGSTFTGELLGHRRDSFYVYEPLWKLIKEEFFNGTDQVCNIVVPKCGPPRENSSFKQAMKILLDIYQCSFDSFEETVLAHFTARKSGESFSTFIDCKENEGSNCTQELKKSCISARHRVTKVLRLSVSNLKILLDSFKNMKIIHLFRDPRAMIWSRIRGWFWFRRQDSLMESHLVAQCSRMLSDYKEGLKLMEDYPGRFKFLIYEDMMENRTYKAKKLYEFLGMKCSSDEEALIQKLERATKTRQLPEDLSRFMHIKTPSFAWRMLLKWKTVKIADKVCRDVYKALGYVSFPDESTYSNYSFVSFRAPGFLSL